MNTRFAWTTPKHRNETDKDIYVIGCGYDHHNVIDASRKRTKNHKIDYHILYFVQGSCTAYINGEKKTVTAGDLVFFNYDDEYQYTYHSSPETIVYWIHFSGERSIELLTDLGFTESFVVHSDTNYSKFFENIIDEIIIKRPHYNKMMKANLLLLLTSIVRKSTVNDPKLDKVISLMNDMSKTGMTLDEYAELCHLSKSQFIRCFKTYTGKTPIKYKNEILVENAKWHLTRSNLSITEISTMLGFENIYYFSTMFKKTTGSSPAEYRKHH